MLLSKLPIHNRAVLHLSADIQPDRDPSAISIRFMQRAALQAKLAQGFDHNQDSPQNTGLSRYAYSHWGILIAVLAPLAVLSVPIIGVLLCCKSQSHPNNKCAAIDEGPTSKQSERIGNWAPLKAVPATSSGSKPGCINLGKDTPLRGNISSNHGGDPPACGVPGASGGESPEVYELLISAGANAHSPLLYEAPVPLPAEPDPLMYEVPASEGAEPTCVKSNERTQPTVLPDDETIQVAGAREDTFPPLNLLSMETSALNRISCTQEACASSEMELICQLAKEEVMLISATDIQLLSEIGRGLLGSVHRALWHVPQKKPQEVTMIGLGTQKDRITLLQTAVTMGRLEHPNVVTTIGIMVEPERVCIVTEYCTNGSLLSYLYALLKRDGIRSVSGIQQLQTFARHIARGMIYLSDKGVIHHGLAAKNVYVFANDTCKIGGIENARLARYDGIVDDSLINWMPVEVLRSSLYSTSSDVWSFGCLLYELWTLGEMPFKGCSPSEVIGMLSCGAPPSSPTWLLQEDIQIDDHCLCIQTVYQHSILVWHPTPSSRPTFRDILAQLEAKDEQTSPLSPEFPDLQSVGEGDNAKVYDLLYRDLHFLYLQQLDDDDYSECEESATPFIGYRRRTNLGNPPAHATIAENELNTSLTYDTLEDEATPATDAITPHIVITVTEDPSHHCMSSIPFRAHPSKGAPPPLPSAPPPRHHSAPDMSSSGALTGGHGANIFGIGSSSALAGSVPGEQLDVDYDEICSDTVSNVEDSVLEESMYDHLMVDNAHKLHSGFAAPYPHGSTAGTPGLTNNISGTQTTTSGVQTVAPGLKNGVSGVESSTSDPQNCSSGLNPSPQSRVPSRQNVASTPLRSIAVNSLNSGTGPESSTMTPQNTAPTPQNTTTAPLNSTPTPLNSTPTPLNSTPTPLNSTPTPQNTTPALLNNFSGFENASTAPISAHQPLVSGEDSAQTKPLPPVTDPAPFPPSQWQYNTMPACLPNPPAPFIQPTPMEQEDDYDEVASDSSSSPATPLPAPQPSSQLCGPPSTFPPPASLYPPHSQQPYIPVEECGKVVHPVATPTQPHRSPALSPSMAASKHVAMPTQPRGSPASLSPSNSNHVATLTNLAPGSPQEGTQMHTIRSAVDSDSDIDYDHLT
eukprot:Em0046g14a